MGDSPLLAAILPRLNRGGAPDSQWPDAKGEYHALCPFHADKRTGNFSVSERGFKCFACDEKGGLKKLADRLGIQAPRPAASGVTLEAYADAKRLPVGYLRALGLDDGSWYGKPAVYMPYRGADGKPLGITRIRKQMAKAAHGPDKRFAWLRKPETAPLALYGLWRLPDMRAGGWVLLVEGESDCHTGWLYDLPLLGVPGANSWRSEWAALLDGLEVYVWQEPDGAGANMAAKVCQSLPRAKVIEAPDGVKDVSAAHLAGRDVVALVSDARTRATLPASAKTLAELAPVWTRLCMIETCPCPVTSKAPSRLSWPGGFWSTGACCWMMARTRPKGAGPTLWMMMGPPGPWSGMLSGRGLRCTRRA
jgi:hypothetical protein